MANVDNPCGLVPVGHLYGAPINGGVRRCYVHASYGTALYVGDPVDLQTETDYQDPLGKHLSVMIATEGDGNFICGVIVGVEARPANLTQQYLPASTGGYVYVNIDPNVIYKVQDDGTGTPAKTWIGSNMLLASGNGSTVTGKSGWELDGDGTSAEDDSFQLMVLGLDDREDNTLEDYADWLVLINTHRFARTSTSDGTAVGFYGVVAT